MTTQTDTTPNEIAQNIIQQLGGNRFASMTGARLFVATGNGLQFSFPNCQRVNKCRVTLDSDDTYTVEFFKIRGANVTPVSSVSMMYAEDLQRHFTDITGLDTHL